MIRAPHRHSHRAYQERSMTVAPHFLDLMRCPVTGQTVQPAAEDVVDKVNAAIRAGKLTNQINEIVDDTIDAALVNADQTVLFPIRNDIVTMVADELIALNQL